MSVRAENSEDVVVDVVGLTKRYAGRSVVDDVALKMRRGEVFGLLGHNGAGKTTTVECLQGLRVPDEGSVRVCGLDPLADRRRLVGRVGSQLQHASLPDRIRVAEALELFAGPRAQPVDDLLETWGLGPQRRTAFGALSGGQQQRLFIALALINGPEVVFLDELTQGLDPHARRTVWQSIEQLRASGTTVVLVTHFLDEAEFLCDRIAVMRDGRIVAAGTPSVFVADADHGAVVRFTCPADLADERLRSVPGIETVGRTGTKVELRGNRTSVAHVGALLVEQGDVPSDLEVVMPNLGDVLIPLMGPE